MAETETVNAEDLKVKMNGFNEDSADSSASQETGGGEPKQNGVNHNHKSSSSSSSSHKHGDGHHKSSSSGSSSSKHHSSSSKHGSSSSSSSKHREGGSSSSSSKHKEGSSSSSSKHHSSSSSSSKHKDGSGHKSSSSSSHKDGKSSSSSKNREGSSSSSSKHSSSSSSSKPKDGSSSSSSSKHRDGHSSSSSKHKDGSSSSKDKHSSSSDKHRDKSKESSSSTSRDKDSSSRHKDSSSRDKDKHKSSSSSSSKHPSSGEKKSSSSSKTGDSERKDKHSPSKKSSDDVKPKQEIKEEKIKWEPIKEEANHVNDFEELAEVKAEVEEPVLVKEDPESPQMKPVMKSEDESEEDDDDKPLSIRKTEVRPIKRQKEESDYEDEAQEDEDDDDDDDDVPLSARATKAKKLKVEKKPVVKIPPKSAKAPKSPKAPKAPPKKPAKGKKRAAVEETTEEPVKKKKKEQEEQEVWRWWEEQGEDTGVKWTYLEHKGPVFAPLYEPLPKSVRFYYEGKAMALTQATEEVATFYGRMLDHDYTTREVFNKNFMRDFRKVMSAEEKATITDLKKCNFHEILDHFKLRTETNKSRSKEEKQRLKQENEDLVKEYGFCTIDRHKEKIGNFKIEPPSLFRGRGDHPKQGMLKTRVQPEDVIINCSKDSKIPQPPKGHKWKEVRHDNTVTWLASWNENIQGATKYVMLNAASKLKGQKDWQKYETARKLHKCVDKIRANYQEDWKSKEMRVRQRAVALYFIDKLALRAGNEKDEESADTVGCCSLRVEHIKLHEERDGKTYVVEFDFLGKDSIRYQNSIPVEKRVFKNLQLFVENKSPEDDLFDRLNTAILNKHLQDLMEGLTAKVFRTYNASRTLSEQLELLTNADDAIAAQLLSYNRANRAVAILCNHQRAVPKSFEKSMENLQKKIDSKKDDIKRTKQDIKAIKAEYKKQKSVKTKTAYEKKKKLMERLEEQLTKLEVQATDKDENKEIALGTSKLNYLDPRISVAWCKKFDVPIEKVYNKTQRDKFRWAIDMATEQFKF